MAHNNRRNKDVSKCPYSLISLQFFLLLPLVKLNQYMGFPTILAFFVALSLPYVLFHIFVKLLFHKNYITLVKHVQAKSSFLLSESDHPHSSDVTLKVILYSLSLGVIASIGLAFIITSLSLQEHSVPLGFYLVLLTSFHFSEYFVTSLTNPSTLSLDSFLINQSLAYDLAIICSLMEFLLEAYFFVEFKKFNVLSLLGLLLAISGDTMRKLAMFTAGKNFSHMISSSKDPEHQLVTHGIYGLMRHPSYAGWFYWAIGSQVLMLNPICLVLFFVASYRFFKERIEYEEPLLIEFFQEDYVSYRRRVGTWMPIKVQL